MFASLRFSKNLSTANLSTISKITISCRTSSLVFVHVSISTEIAATFFTDNIRSAMNEGKYKGAIYIDLSKAFDTISHSILLKTLHNYGISGRYNEWLADYLFCRSQQVSYILISWNTFFAAINLMWCTLGIHLSRKIQKKTLSPIVLENHFWEFRYLRQQFK